MILGAQKCGTTTLFRILTAHPRIVGPEVKEPHYFSLVPDWRRELSRYEAMFTPREGALYCDASTTYTFYPHRNLEIWRDIHAYNPAMKFLYIVRNPVDRMSSAHRHHRMSGYTQQTFREALRSNPMLWDITRYHSQIAPFIRTFGRERVMILEFDDLMWDRREALARVTGFLGIDFGGLGDFDHVHANASVDRRPRARRLGALGLAAAVGRWLLPRSVRRALWPSGLPPKEIARPYLSAAEKRAIVHMLESEIAGLEQLMERDLSRWRDCRDDQPATSDAGASLPFGGAMGS